MTANITTAETPVPLAQPSPQARHNALILVIGFALIILFGTVLLRLPVSSAGEPLTWSEAFFTSASATTVTGLGVITTATDLSLFGQIVVLLLIEIGGVGFITFSVLLFALIGRRIGIAERVLLTQSLGVSQGMNIRGVALRVLGWTLAIQLLGALLLWLRWQGTLGGGQAAYLAIFHSISAFCNAGFDLYAGAHPPLFGFGRDPFSLSVLEALIFIGTLGILVVVDLVTWPWDRRLSIYTKLTLVVQAGLLLLGTLTLLADSIFGGTALAAMSGSERFSVSLFTVVSARTAGLAVIPMDQLSEASALIIMVSMFIGGAPASMGGGVTTSTVAVLLVAVVSTVRGSPQALAFGRVLPLETIGKAVAIMTVSTLLCFFVTLLLLFNRSGELFPVAFETVSAFSNTGYSLGVTSQLSTFGRLLIIFTMFWGRLGPLTLVVLLAQRERMSYARYPAEQIVIG